MFFGVGGWEPKNLDLLELCTSQYPNKTWDDLTCFQQVELIRCALKPQQFLLDPHCTYVKYWDMLVLFALCYTSIVTPYEVGFLETKVNGLFYFNRCIDAIFFKDMLMQFFTKVQRQTQKGTVWIKDRRTIIKNYMRGWFWIDLFSILPFDIVGLYFNSPEVKRLKAIRIVRLLRLLKLVRVLRASRIIKRWQNRTSMSFALQGLCKFAVLLVLIAHWMACIWGMIGYLLGTDLNCDPDDEAKFNTINETKDGVSWITTYSWGPDSPCQSFDVYLAALHFSVMTITSIGYGDITPTRKEENIVCILCQLFGGLTWAYVIGSICGIIANSSPTKVAFEQSMDALNSMLVEQDVEFPLRWKLREFLREQQYHHFLMRARNISESFSPTLQGELTMQTAIGSAITKVWYFRDCSTAFVVEVAQCLKAAQYSPRDRVGCMGTLSIVQRGSVARSGRILLPGNFWGEDMIVKSQFLLDDTPGITLNFVELLSLRKQVLDDILVDYPDVEAKIRKAAVTIAFRTAVRIVAQERLLRKRLEQGELSPQAATNFDGTPNQQASSRVRGLSAIFDQLPSGGANAAPFGRRSIQRRQSALELIDGIDTLSDPDREQDVTPRSNGTAGKPCPVQDAEVKAVPEQAGSQKDQLDRLEKLLVSELAAIRKEIRGLNTNGERHGRSDRFGQENPIITEVTEEGVGTQAADQARSRQLCCPERL